MSRPPAGNPFELFTVIEPGMPKNPKRDSANPEFYNRKMRIEMIEEKKDQAKREGEVWDI